MAFAHGKKAKAICPRCGHKRNYTQLRREWDGRIVCHRCYDPKHPRLDRKRGADQVKPLRHPRPDLDDMGVVDEQLAEAVKPTFGSGENG
jgi:hypothetical protein